MERLSWSFIGWKNKSLGLQQIRSQTLRPLLYLIRQTHAGGRVEHYEELIPSIHLFLSNNGLDDLPGELREHSELGLFLPQEFPVTSKQHSASSYLPPFHPELIVTLFTMLEEDPKHPFSARQMLMQLREHSELGSLSTVLEEDPKQGVSARKALMQLRENSELGLFLPQALSVTCEQHPASSYLPQRRHKQHSASSQYKPTTITRYLSRYSLRSHPRRRA